VASRRIELGFDGGAVLRLTVDDGQIPPLSKALGDVGVHAVTADEGEHWLRTSEVRYLRVIPGEVGNKVGFGNGA
jgi:hypothetical protein